jgi:nucleoside-diphosphate-sugar epimerase
MNIFITGATGFLGSNIARFLVDKGHCLIATKRADSNMDRCVSFVEVVSWVDTNEQNWLDNVIEFKPELIIHTAWSGVGAATRDDLEIQRKNIDFITEILHIAEKVEVKKLISLGSQAEYGIFAGRATEAYAVKPVDNYGKVKLEVLELFRNFCNVKGIEWYWLRVFSVLGTNENPEWLVPQTITKLKNGRSIALTGGEQVYDYLYMDDFLERLNQVIEYKLNVSGIYNLCSGRAVQIKQLLLSIAAALGVSTNLLQFGAIPYRTNQNMNIVGCPDKFEMTFGKVALEDLEESIKKIIM